MCVDHQTSQLHPIITNMEYLLYTEHNHCIVLLSVANGAADFSAWLKGSSVIFLWEEEEVH